MSPPGSSTYIHHHNCPRFSSGDCPGNWRNARTGRFFREYVDARFWCWDHTAGIEEGGNWFWVSLSFCRWPPYLPASLLAAKIGGLSLLFGMTTIAGSFEVLLSRIMHRLRALFPAEVTGLVVLMVGIAVIPAAIPNFMGLDATDTVTEIPELIIGFITLGTMVGLNVWSKGKLKLYSVLIGMILGYIAAFLLGILNVSHIELFREAPLVAFPNLEYFGWSFDFFLLVPFLIAIICSSLKSVGDITTCQKINDVEWKRPDMKNIGGGILSDGLSAIVSGLVGAMGHSTSSSNVGLSIGTGATSRRIAFAAGGILIILALFPKLAAVFVKLKKLYVMIAITMKYGSNNKDNSCNSRPATCGRLRYRLVLKNSCSRSCTPTRGSFRRSPVSHWICIFCGGIKRGGARARS